MAKFPIKMTEYLHGDKFGEDDRFDELVEQGYPEDSLPRYIVYELECEVEVHENGDVFITHVAGQKLPTPIRNT